jgi:hypothetical protein
VRGSFSSVTLFFSVEFMEVHDEARGLDPKSMGGLSWVCWTGQGMLGVGPTRCN